MKQRLILLTVFGACFIYWTYLILHAEMLIRFDAIGYQQLGSLIHDKGWIEFFKTGPHREPLYPFLIAVSMGIAERLDVAFDIVQKTLQVGLLFISQLLLLNLLRKLNVRLVLQVFTILYMGFSPALVNTAFSLFSEISSLPFVLLIIHACFRSIQLLLDNKAKGVAIAAILTGLIFLGASFSKGVFLYLFHGWSIFLVIGCVYTFYKGDNVTAKRILLYLMIACGVFNVSVTAFKSANYYYNGQFAFTDRFSDLLFGNALKRSQPLTQRIVAAHLASIPGDGVCRRFFTEQECKYSSFAAADDFRGGPLSNLVRDVPKEERNAKIISLAVHEVKQHPFQYMLFMVIESLRMFFWESTQIGFVAYPLLLQHIFDNPIFKDGLRLIISLVTAFAFIYTLVMVVKQPLNKIIKEHHKDLLLAAIFIIFLLCYIGLFSLFSVVTRYALPVAPLFLLCIALCLERMFVIKKSLGGK